MNKFKIAKDDGDLFVLTANTNNEYLILANTGCVMIEFMKENDPENIWSGLWKIDRLVSIYKMWENNGIVSIYRTNNRLVHNYAAVFNTICLGKPKEIIIYINLETAQALIYFYNFKLKGCKIENCPTDGLERTLK